MLYANYHTHTFRCGHAELCSDEEIVQTAIEQGIRILGFTDHVPWPYVTGFINEGERMPPELLQDYIDSIRSLKEKYRGKITVYLGLECEYAPDYYPWLVSREKWDYLILGNHWAYTNEDGSPGFYRDRTPEQVARYAQCTVSAMETGLFRFVAHPELGIASCEKFDDACEQAARLMCRTARQLDIPMEYNLYGVDKRERGKFRNLGYPVREFWEIAAQECCTAIIGVDAHTRKHLTAEKRMDDAQALLDSLGIQVLKTLPGLEE